MKYTENNVVNIPTPSVKENPLIGPDPKKNNIQFKEDDWESPTLGASGLGWEIRCNGMEICQYTYFPVSYTHLRAHETLR